MLIRGIAALLVGVALALGSSVGALAQAPATVKLCVQNGTTCTPVSSGNPLPVTGGGSGGGGAVYGPTAAGSAAANPPVLIGGTVDGTATGAVDNLKVSGGLAYVNCSNCSGSGISVSFGGAIGSVGTPGGFKDGSGNFQALLGDVTNGQWVSVKASVLPTGAATSALQSTNSATTAHTCSVSGFSELGCLGQIDDDVKSGVVTIGSAVSGVATAIYPGLNVAGTARGATGSNPSGSIYAQDSNIASVGGSTLSLGQQLAAASIPVVLTAAQISTLTPLSTVAATQSGNWTSRIVGNGGATLDAAPGSAPTNAVSVQGVAGMTALAVTMPTTPSVANGSAVVIAASATNGALTAGAIAPNNTTAVVIKGSAGTLYGVQLAGLGAAPAYLKIYNATSATCGSGTPVKRLMIPAASTAANGAGSNISFGPQGIAFSSGITYCVTTGITDADATAPAASTFLINVDYD